MRHKNYKSKDLLSLVYLPNKSMARIVLTICLNLSLMTRVVESATCFYTETTEFPYIFGGTNANTIFNTMDISASGILVAAGSTLDSSLVTSSV